VSEICLASEKKIFSRFGVYSVATSQPLNKAK